MKKITLLLLLAFVWRANLHSQHITTDRVPGLVGKAFRAKFPHASQDSWSKSGEHTYEVVFFNDRKKQSADFDDTGKWLQTETEAKLNQVPPVVLKKLNKEFADYNVQEVDLREQSDGTFYMLTINKGSKGFYLKYSAKGELIEKKEATGEDTDTDPIPIPR